MKFQTTEGSLDVAIRHLTVAGWTGRDRPAVDHHIQELAALGVAPPSSVPLYYRTSFSLLTQASTIEVVGDGSSGEAEPLIIQHAGKIWLGLGSDHTDRDLEAHSVAHSKQVCAKPVASSLWPWGDVQAHADSLQLSSWVWEQGEWQLYQSGTLDKIRPLTELIEGAGFADGSVMLSGTLPAIGGVRPSLRFRMSLADPVLVREITHEYAIRTLPIIE